ncbi:ADP-ribosylglycohydrolase family protein [Streptomyces sp. NPDC001594]|uniref:ADP-ribosylglycohydrolase family protein n=1 Tax=Streptomyces sp. NPDC001594 TaxID=3364590 RepID=UPI0036826BE6
MTKPPTAPPDRTPPTTTGTHPAPPDVPPRSPAGAGARAGGPASAGDGGASEPVAGAPRSAAAEPASSPSGRTAGSALVRLTWAQPEDLVGHELRQAAEDGRDAGPLLRTWLAAGGHPAPARAGASPAPAGPELRALATRLLDELAALPVPSAADEPTSWPAIRATWPRAGRTPLTDPGPTSPGPLPAGTRRPDPADAHRPTSPAGPERSPAPEREPAAAPAATAPRAAPARAAGAGADGPAAGADALCERLEAAWVGRAVGCVLGKPVEKLPLHGIRALARAAGNWPLDDWFTARGVPAELLAAHPWNRRSAATSLAENIDGTPEDDDLNHPLLGLLLLQRHGRRFTTADLGRLWLDELPAGRAFTAERIAYRNLLLGLEPPLTATHHNPFREWIGALIRADVHGWTNPGDPAAAAEQAWRDASLSHTATGLHAALFAAATLAEAASGRADVHGALRAGLAVVPPRSRLAEAVRFGIRTAREEGDFERVVDLLHARYGGYHWVHALPNTALIAAALTHADGDFTRSVCGAVSGGWDTDSNGATAGSVAGLLAGSPDRIPERWTAPLRNRLSTTVAGFDGVGFDTLARLTAQEAARP